MRSGGGETHRLGRRDQIGGLPGTFRTPMVEIKPKAPALGRAGPYLEFPFSSSLLSHFSDVPAHGPRVWNL